MRMGVRRSIVLAAAVSALLSAAVILPADMQSAGGATSPSLGGCPMLPADNAWNQKVNTLPLWGNSSTLIKNISSTGKTNLHADFGGNGAYGIPFKIVPATEPKKTIHYTAWGDESDPGPFPIPSNTPVEGAPATDGDRHVLVLQQGTCHLFELGRAFWKTNHWDATVGVNWDLKSNARRPLRWTSADAAGLPILPGLVRYDEVAAGHIDHAVRFTVPKTRKAFIYPATHYASSNNSSSLPAMGQRLRLKASFSLTGYKGQSLVILKALKTYGMIVADNGSGWFITGSADKRWNDTDLNQLKRVPGTVFEVVNTGPARS